MYNIENGETLEDISKRVYGNENQTELLKSANPDLGNTLSPNASLIIPTDPNAPKNNTILIDSNIENQVTLLINGKEYKYFLNLKIILSIDRITSIDFEAPMESERQDFKDTFQPFSFADIQVFIGKELIFTGTMIDVNPSVTVDSKVVQISGYAKCGVLNDCTPSSNQLDKLEFNGVKLSTIANSLIKPFGIKAIFKDDEGSTFEQVAIEADGNILSFLIDLANKRELVISSDENGDLVFQKAILKGDIVGNLEQSISPVQKIRANFNPQNYFSHITGLEPVEIGTDGGKYTVKNDLLKSNFRPFNFKVQDTETADIKKAVNMKMGKMLGDMVSYDIDLNTWTDEKGNLFKPNTFIKLKAVDTMIYTSYTFLIKSVVLDKDSDLKMSTLNLVLSESYSGNTPKAFPWQE